MNKEISNIEINDVNYVFSDEEGRKRISTLESKNKIQDETISKLVGGNPKGTYPTLSALTTANPSTGVYIVLENGHAYGWEKDGSATDIGVYQSTEIEDESINHEKTSFMKKVSILNPDLCIEGYLPRNVGYNSDLTNDDNVSVEGIGFCTSQCFECKEGEKYIHNANTYNLSLYLADETKAVIQEVLLSKNTVYTIPAGVKYFRFVFTINASDMTNGMWKTKVKLIKGESLEDTLLYGQNGIKNLVIDEEMKSDTIIVPEGKSYSEGEAIMLLNFDGWNQNTFNIMAPYLKEKNIPFTLFFTGYDNATGININDLRNYMKERGQDFELGLYSGVPSSTMEGVSNYAEQFAQIKRCLDGIINYGLPKPKHISYSGGKYSSTTEDICNNILGLKTGRSTENSKIVNEVTGAFTIPCSGYGDDGTWTISVVDSIVNGKQHRACMTHNILSEEVTDTSYNIRESYLKAWVDKIATAVNNGTLKCMTFTQYYLYTILPHSANIGQHAIVRENDGKQHEYVYTVNGWIELTDYNNYR